MSSALVRISDNAVIAVYDASPPVPVWVDGVSLSGLAVGGSVGGYELLPAIIANVDGSYNPLSAVPAGSMESSWSGIASNGSVAVTRVWAALPVVPAAFTPLQFMGLFTDAELAAIASSPDSRVAVWRLKAAAAQQIIINDPQTVAGINFLAAQSLLTADRAAAILAAT